MGTIDIKIDKTADEFIKRIRSMIEPATGIFLNSVAEGLTAKMKNEAPINKTRTTGSTPRTLKDSIDWNSPADFVRWVGPNVDYALFVEEGTDPHEIRAVNAKALGPFAMSSYLGKRVGGFVGRAAAKKHGIEEGLQFFVRVQHPGTSPNPFIQRTAEAAPDIIESAGENFWKNILGQ
jgi:hypothetical protein